MAPNVTLRVATPSDCDALTRLALASKAHWGYDEAFMQACVPALTITSALFARHHVVVAEATQTTGFDATPEPLGFYALSQTRPEAEVECCFVDPTVIGGGVGGLLWRDLEAFARANGVVSLTLAADPNASGFYRHMGMNEAGSAPSDVFGPDRPLPVFKKLLEESPAP